MVGPWSVGLDKLGLITQVASCCDMYTSTPTYTHTTQVTKTCPGRRDIQAQCILSGPGKPVGPGNPASPSLPSQQLSCQEPQGSSVSSARRVPSMPLLVFNLKKGGFGP